MSLDPLTAALDAGKAILDKIWPDAGEMERSKVQMALAIYAGQAEIVKAEAQSEHWLAACWRPILMLTFGGLIVARWLGWSAPNITEAEVLKLWSIVERCADGHFFEGSRDVCLPHSTQHCKDGLEYKVNGTAFQDETCAICTDCTGMRQVSACSVHADATCTDCGKNEWWNSYWRGTDCELACKETYTKLLQPPRCQHCSLCGKGSIRPTEPRNCSHCIPCQSPKPAYARYLEECTWQCFEFYTLIATSNSSECVYTENWQTSDWVAAPEVPLEVVCEVGYRLENFACLRCDTPLGLSNVTMDEQWFWTPGDCTWSCMPDRTHLINNTNGTQTHSCVTWATYRLATLVKRSRRLTAPAPAPPNVTSVVQNSETQPSVEVVLFAAAGFFGFFVCVACCVIMRVKRKRGNYKPLPEN
jgi:hypothetical protein